MRWVEAATTAEAIARLLAKHGLAPRPPPSSRTPPSSNGQLSFAFARSSRRAPLAASSILRPMLVFLITRIPHRCARRAVSPSPPAALSLLKPIISPQHRLAGAWASARHALVAHSLLAFSASFGLGAGAECQEREVAILWGLELLLRLVEARALPARDAIELAEAIHRLNKRIPGKSSRRSF
jgi:hypothetical protein